LRWAIDRKLGERVRPFKFENKLEPVLPLNKIVPDLYDLGGYDLVD